ncbi:hypothetical protein Lal_00042992 [Lupinus albus]|nr:hypothetical protein Lal_00042992 [Lupinus albus]
MWLCRLHYGSTCPGKGNECFHCKEFGHIKRYCPKLDRRPNVMHAGEARDHGRMVTPSGAGTSGVDDPARGKRMVTGLELEEKREKGAFQEQGALGLILELAKSRLHYGSTCPGKGNECFHCKEFGHIKRYCPKLDRRPNVMHAGEARDHGRMVTPSGAGTSGVDDPARGKRMVTEILRLEEIAEETFKVTRNRSPTFTKYHFWKSRLSERFSPERERITLEGEILGYIGGFSPERELSRLGEKWQIGAIDTVRFSLERERQI